MVDCDTSLVEDEAEPSSRSNVLVIGLNSNLLGIGGVRGGDGDELPSVSLLSNDA